MPASTEKTERKGGQVQKRWVIAISHSPETDFFLLLELALEYRAILLK